MRFAPATIRVTAFGSGRFDVPLLGDAATVADILRPHNLETAGRRLAVNGHPAEMGTGVLEGDEVSLVPRVHGG